VASAGVGSSEAKERWNTEIDMRILQKEKSVQGSLLWQPATKTSFSLSYRMARYDYGETDIGAFHYSAKLNRDETYYNLTAYRSITARTRLFLDAEYGYFDFANPLLSKDSESYAGYGGFEFSPFGKIKGRLKVGYKLFNSLNPQRVDYEGIVGDTSISIRPIVALAARVFFRRDVQFSVWYDNTYFLENILGAGASVYLNKNIRLDYDYSRGGNEYPEEGGDIAKRLDVYQIHSVGLYFRLRENTAFGIIASRWVRDSNLDWEDDDRDFLGFNLTYNF
jgi:hypothetical protein